MSTDKPPKNILNIKDPKTVAKEQKAQQVANQKVEAAKLADYSAKKHAKRVTDEEIKKIKNPKAASAAKKDLDKLVKNPKLQKATVLQKIEEKYVEIKQSNKDNQPTQEYARGSFSGQVFNLSSREAIREAVIAQRKNPTQSGKFGDDIRHAYSAATFDLNKVRSTTTSNITSPNTPNNKKTTEQSKGR